MNSQLFLGRDSKTAINKARAALGDDARILSTTRCPSGIEITAISGRAFSGSQPEGSSNETADNNHGSANEISLGYLDRELKELRKVIFNALGSRAWKDIASKEPVMSALEQRLLTLGLSRASSDKILRNIPASASLNEGWLGALSALASALKISPLRYHDNGIKVVLGGTICSRSLVCRQLINAALAHTKPKNLLLISMFDDTSNGLVSFCKHRKVKRVQLRSAIELKNLVQRLGRSKIIIVEAGCLSPSLGVNDPVLQLFAGQQFAIKAIPIISAVHQSEALLAQISHLQRHNLSGAIISDLHSAVSLGPLLDALVRSELTISGLSDCSQQELTELSPTWLINAAKRLTRQNLGNIVFDGPVNVRQVS